MSANVANVMLLLAAFFWGAGNVAQKAVLLQIGPFTAIAMRGLIALAVILPFVFWEVRSKGKRTFADFSALLRPSLVFCLALGAQQVAFGGTSVTNASFLVNATVMFTPLVAWIISAERPRPTTVFAALLATAGVALMAGGIDGVAWGDAMCLMSALLYSIWVVLVARVSGSDGRPFALAACQFAVTASVGTLTAGLFESTSLSSVLAAGPELLVLGVLSTAAAFALQALAQQWTTASDAVVVMSAESVFGALAGAVVLGECPSTRAALGALVILAAIAVTAIRDAAWLGHRRMRLPTGHRANGTTCSFNLPYT